MRRGVGHRSSRSRSVSTPIIFECMFEDWINPPGVEILCREDRPVEVFGTGLWCRPGSSSLSRAPGDVRAHGLKIGAFHPGRQVAWVRLSSGGWLAVVDVELSTVDGSNAVDTVLWLQPHQLRLPK